MSRPIIEEQVCKGCGLCVAACPKKILELANDKINQKGYNPARCIEEAQCIGCAICGIICPDSAITVEKD
ncbi:MAG: 4Fe-4S dicluster domain-containing protein [Angelakisella sp.]